MNTEYESVKERWWHRLLKVGIALIVLAVALLGSFISFDDAQYQAYIHSFELNYEANRGHESQCVASEYTGSLSCGGVESLDDLLARLSSAAKSNSHLAEKMKVALEQPKYVEKKQPRYRFVEEPVQPKAAPRDLLAENGITQSTSTVAAKDLIEDFDIRYKSETRYNYPKLALGLSLTLAAAAFSLLLGIGVYKLIYISHMAILGFTNRSVASALLSQ